MKNPPLIRFTLTLRGLLVIAVIGVLVFFAGTRWSKIEDSFQPTATRFPSTLTSTQTQTVTQTATDTLTPTIVLTPTVTQTGADVGPLGQGVMVLSLTEGGFAHLFAYQPQSLPLTRLTNHPWDDITPALSPDGQRLAFSSRQNGYWNLYLLDLISGQLTRLTDDPDYKASPSWSPDGKWLVYESYRDGNWSLPILSLDDLSQPAIPLTTDPTLDESPAWSPQGRLIAFVSTRSGPAEIWVADLDKVEDRFEKISNIPGQREWSSGLVARWDTTGVGLHLKWDFEHLCLESDPARPSAAPGGRRGLAGMEPGWPGAHDRLQTPNQTFLAGYQVLTGNIVFPPDALPASLQGIDWKPGRLPSPLPSALAQVSKITPTPLWQPTVSPATGGPTDRQKVVPLNDVTAPNPFLSEAVDASFEALRQRVADEIGWDFLASLENAFIPLESSLPPDLDDDWLYTGRSFAANAIPISGVGCLWCEKIMAYKPTGVFILRPATRMAHRALRSTSFPGTSIRVIAAIPRFTNKAAAQQHLSRLAIGWISLTWRPATVGSVSRR